MCGGALYSMTLGAEGTQIKLTLEKRRNCDKIKSGEEGTPIKLKLEQKEHWSLLCVEQQSTVLYDTWIRKNSNKIETRGERALVSALCGAQRSTVLYDNWSRRDSNKTDIGEEGTVIKLRVEKKELQ